MDKKILYIDMDGVIVDFWESANRFIQECDDEASSMYYDKYPSAIPDIFLNASPIENAIYSVNKLNESNKYDMFIATSPPCYVPDAWAQKVKWIKTWFGNDLFKDKIIMTHRKDLLKGDILIDDRIVNGAGYFKPKFIHFGTPKYKDWDCILNELL